MSGETTRKVAIGEVVGILKPWNPFIKRAKVLVKIDEGMIAIFVDHRQLDYVRKKFASKSSVAVGYYRDEWHLGTPPATDQQIAEKGSPHREGQSLNELDGTPGHFPDLWSDTSQPDTNIENDIMFDDIVEHHEYIRRVETDIKEHGDEILGQLGLSHLKDGSHLKKRDKHAPGGDKLDIIIELNNKILIQQEELLFLLKRYIFTNEDNGNKKI